MLSLKKDEDLIRWGWPEDVWFHVDNYSSAHVYLRLNKGQTIEDIPQEVLIDASQLVKANSIQGNKINDIYVVYTMWQNLKKTSAMEPGQVAFFSEKEVKKIKVEKKKNEIVNRLNKTKTEDYPDLRLRREKRDAIEREQTKQILKSQKEEEKKLQKQKLIEADLSSYSTLLKTENMKSNYDDGNDSDEFM